MKIYWLTMGGYKSFFRLSKIGIMEEVRVREEPDIEFEEMMRKEDPDWKPFDYCWGWEEEEVEDELFGICKNNFPRHTGGLALSTCPECSVGSIRKMRSGTKNGIKGDGLCNSCPYFISPEQLNRLGEENYEVFE